eukprot:scpid49083/ scgid21669/ E3 ubiquitin-protein ligase TRIM33; Ectodermin homolog; RET-fused gene 7 protein; Transcription intermediary factor 1-gamma; Tripartite motif-containing protein 33
MSPPKCASCGESKEEARLISCLHSLCVACLERHVEGNSEDDSETCVKCPSCAVLTPFQAGRSVAAVLPLSYPAQLRENEWSSDDPAKLQCDECGDNEPALATCSDCKAKLCDVHAKSHPRSKATFKHTVMVFPDSPSDDTSTPVQAGTTRSCDVHSTHTATHFCCTCCQALCAEYSSKACHVGDSHDIQPLADTAEWAREMIQNNLQGVLKGSDGLELASSRVREALRCVNSQGEEGFKQITAFFDMLTESLKTRETNLRTELSETLTEKKSLLEKRLCQLTEGSERCDQVAGILESCNDTVDLLRMYGWLNTAIIKSQDSVGDDAAGECAASGIVFNATDTAPLTELVDSAGSIADVSDSVLECLSDSAPVGSEMKIKLKPRIDLPKLSLTEEQIGMLGIEISVSSPSNRVTPYSPRQVSAEGCFEATHCPTVPGTYTVLAKVGGELITGEPLQVSVVPAGPTFDNSQCHGDLELSNGKRTARKVESAGWRSVCTPPVPAHGVTEYRLRIDSTSHDSCIIFGACLAAEPRLDAYHSTREELVGWYGGATTVDNWGGSALGQLWSSGDVFTLTFDADKQTLRAHHDRTDTTETVSGVQGTARLYVSMGNKGDQVSLVCD